MLDYQSVALPKCGTVLPKCGKVFYHFPYTRYHMDLRVGENLCCGIKCEMSSLTGEMGKH